MRITSPGKSIWKDTVGLFERFDSVSPGPEDILFETAWWFRSFRRFMSMTVKIGD
jgi:hypothetical protein